MNYSEIIRFIKSHYNEKDIRGMERFGINPKNNYCTPIPALRKLARKTGRDHQLALRLWKSGIHDARILASIVDDPEAVTPAQMEQWAKDFDSWDVCDQTVSNLFSRTKYAWQKAKKWSRARPEFVKRAGFVLIAALAVHDKKADNEQFVPFLAVIMNGSVDGRNFVKKAVNWALRQVGKRNAVLYKLAYATAEEIGKIDSDSARWVASNALSEFNDLSPVMKKRAGLA